jgi:hypothetical protein
MKIGCEAPCWLETVQGNDERSGQSANADDPANINPVAKMTEANFTIVSLMAHISGKRAHCGCHRGASSKRQYRVSAPMAPLIL